MNDDTGSIQCTLIPGDGIGPEVASATRMVLDAAATRPIAWETHEAGGDVIGRYGKPLPDTTLESVRRTGVALKGPITTPVGSGFRSVNVELRKTLDLYANVRPARTLPGVRSRYEDVDLIIVRENTEGLYSGLEHIVVPGVVESIRIITERCSERIVRFAFETARRQGRKRVTAVHKANILKLSDGLFLECARRIAREYPEIGYDEAIVDAAAMNLVVDPHRYDVLVMENLFGDIVSDLCAGLVGGLGLAPSANIGDRYAMFEAVHGSAPDIAGKGVANPSALILAGALMLKHLGDLVGAARVERAVVAVLTKGEVLTRDLGGTADTTRYTEAVLAALED
jgi:isocitrate dehydrogenase (NAD+)